MRRRFDPRISLPALLALMTAVFPAAAADPDTASEPPATAIVGIMKAVPPYVMEFPSSGMDVDILSAVFSDAGIEIGILHVPFSRLDGLVDARLADAAVTVQPHPSCTASRPFTHWHDAMVVAKPYADTIKEPADLAGRRFAIFPKADAVLGPYLAPLRISEEQAIIANEHHMALRLLVRERIVAYIGDLWALDHLWFTLYGNEPGTRPYIVAREFPPSPHALCFASEAMRDRFDRSLERLQANGAVDAIIAHYRETP